MTKIVYVLLYYDFDELNGIRGIFDDEKLAKENLDYHSKHDRAYNYELEEWELNKIKKSDFIKYED